MGRVRCSKCGAKFGGTLEKCPQCGARGGRQPARTLGIGLVVVTLGIAGAAWAFKPALLIPSSVKQVHSIPQERQTTLGDLLTMSRDDIAKMDLAEMNLLCAQGLPGSENLDIAQCLRTLDDWARQVEKMTVEKIYVYRENPAQWNNSENWWRVAAMVGYLNRVVGTSYNPELKDKRPVDDFDVTCFKSSKDVFIHGLLAGKKQGTCSSMPVLVVSLGRRLGYPLKLVKGAGHLFARWEDKNERFNIEATDRFAESKTDDFYHNWPYPNRVPLESLTPVEELTACLGFRGCCQMSNGLLRDAEVSFAHAHALDIYHRGHIPYLERLLFVEQVGDPSLPPPPTW